MVFARRTVPLPLVEIHLAQQPLLVVFKKTHPQQLALRRRGPLGLNKNDGRWKAKGPPPTPFPSPDAPGRRKPRLRHSEAVLCALTTETPSLLVSGSWRQNPTNIPPSSRWKRSDAWRGHRTHKTLFNPPCQRKTCATHNNLAFCKA